MRQDSKKFIPLIIALCFLIILVLTACWGSSEKKETTQTTAPAAAEGVVGQPLRMGDAVWTVTSVERAPALGEGSDAPSGQFVAVHVTLQNASKETQTAPDLTVIDSQGNKTTSNTDKFVIPPDSWGQSMLGTGLGGGATVNGYYVFDVLPSATGFKLQVEGWALTEEQKAFINLGI